jgi:phage terminase small subunit
MLTNQQKLFCQEYLKLGMNATQAYMKVYKTCKKEETAMANASRLLRNVKVKEYIEELQSKVEEKAIVSIEDIVKELTAIAFTDRTKISKMVTKEKQLEKTTLVYKAVDFSDTDTLDNETKKVIAGYKQTQSGLAVETYDKMKALELLGKYLGMFTETVKIENPEATKILSSISKQLGGKSE